MDRNLQSDSQERSPQAPRASRHPHEMLNTKSWIRRGHMPDGIPPHPRRVLRPATRDFRITYLPPRSAHRVRLEGPPDTAAPQRPDPPRKTFLTSHSSTLSVKTRNRCSYSDVRLINVKNFRNSITSMARALLVTTALVATLSPALPAAADDDPDMETTEASPVGIDSSGNSLPWQPDNSEAAGPADSEDSVPGHKPDSTESAPSSVIAGDDRVQFTDTTSYPNSAIVYITKDGKTHCTGWMISADTLVTAGHCVYSYEREEWFSGLEFSPGANGSERPFETAKAVQTWTDVSWVKKGSPLLDWGVVKLDKRLGERSGWFGFAWRSGEYKDIKTELRGYPYDKNPGELWGMSGTVAVSRGNQHLTNRSKCGLPHSKTKVHTLFGKQRRATDNTT